MDVKAFANLVGEAKELFRDRKQHSDYVEGSEHWLVWHVATPNNGAPSEQLKKGATILQPSVDMIIAQYRDQKGREYV